MRDFQDLTAFRALDPRWKRMTDIVVGGRIKMVAAEIQRAVTTCLRTVPHNVD